MLRRCERRDVPTPDLAFSQSLAADCSFHKSIISPFADATLALPRASSQNRGELWCQTELGERDRLCGMVGVFCQCEPPPADIAPFAKLEADMLVDSQGLEAGGLVQADAGFVRPGDA